MDQPNPGHHVARLGRKYEKNKNKTNGGQFAFSTLILLPLELLDNSKVETNDVKSDDNNITFISVAIICELRKFITIINEFMLLDLYQSQFPDEGFPGH